MLGHPDILASFLDAVAAVAEAGPDTVELVIHGDFVDFLAEAPWSRWTVDEGAAIKKLENALGRVPQILGALTRCVSKVHRFTLLLGNHDIELALPRVRERMFSLLETGPHRCHFIFNNEAYRVGDLLIEHGNRYDAWNRIDHDGLRQTLSALSRGETPDESWLAPCPGSTLVVKAMNPLKEQFRFIDLLKPEDKLLSLFLRQVAPSFKRLMPHLLTYERSNAERFRLRVLPPRSRRRFIAGEETPSVNLPDDIAADEAVTLAQDAMMSKRIAADDEPPEVARSPLIDELVDPSDPLTASTVRSVQSKLRKLLTGDRTFSDSDIGEKNTAVRHCYEEAKAQIERGSARVVVMGHTHLRRNIEVGSGRYINTGTWADLIQVDPAMLLDTATARQALNGWWRRLLGDDPSIRFHDPSFADVRLSADLCVATTTTPVLRRYKGRAIDD